MNIIALIWDPQCRLEDELKVNKKQTFTEAEEFQKRTNRTHTSRQQYNITKNKGKVRPQMESQTWDTPR